MNKQLRMQLHGLLDSQEKELLNKVNHATARYELHYGGTGPDSDDEKYEQWMAQVSAMEEHFKSVIERLTTEKQSTESFEEKYLEWRENRTKCIAKLKKIAKSLDEDRFLCNVLKLSGYVLSLVGGALCLSSGLVVDSNVTPTLTIAGSAVTTVGVAAVSGSSITETVRLKRKVKKAKKLLEEDKKYFTDVSDWLNHTMELQEALTSVLDIDIVKDITDSTKKIVGKAVKIKDDHKRLKIIEKGVKSILDTVGSGDDDVPIAAVVTIIRVYTTVALLLCKTENRLVCDFAALSAKSVTAVAVLVVHSANLFGVARLIAADSAVVAKIALGVVGMVFDSIRIVRTSVDIYKQSRSPEGKKIFQAAENLSEEAGVLDNVYMVAQNLQERERMGTK